MIIAFLKIMCVGITLATTPSSLALGNYLPTIQYHFLLAVVLQFSLNLERAQGITYGSRTQLKFDVEK